jgi:hypothetical protein
VANTLIVTSFHDYRPDSLPNDIETIQFTATAGVVATFNASQFGSQISNTVAIVGNGQFNSIIVDMNASTNFSAAGWTFQNWVASDSDTIIHGTANDDTIIGSSQRDVIDGGAGGDTLAGGTGNDSYSLDDVHVVQIGVHTVDGGTAGISNTTYAYDSVVENPNGGIDEVSVTPVLNGTSYTLPANVENGAVGGSGAFTLTGNELDNLLEGNASGNTLIGLGGDDRIYGGIGNDVFNGGAGHDVLTGDGAGPSAGADRFVFDASALTDAQAATPIFDEVKDYDQGGGKFNVAEGDVVDVSAIVQSAFDGGQSANALVRVVDDPSNAHALLQVDSDGTANGILWNTVAQLDGIHGGETVNAILDSSQIGGAGTALYVLSNDGHFGDFDGDHEADLVWRDDDGSVAIWQMNGGGVLAGNFLTGVSSSWHIVGTGDFNADGKADILWLNDDGSLLDWQMASSSAIGSTPGFGTAPANNYLAGIGDVNQDGKSDLIWRDATTGAVTISETGGAKSTLSGVDNTWSVVGVGDYNGDGTADIMFRNAGQGITAAWLVNGTSVTNTVFYPGVPNDWHVIGTGDFDGNGTADLFWHNDNGANAVWLMNSSGGIQQSAFFSGVSSDWHVVGTGDFNGDHKDDVIWRNDNGATAVWLMNGGNAPTAAFPGGAPLTWDTQAHHYDFV